MTLTAGVSCGATLTKIGFFHYFMFILVMLVPRSAFLWAMWHLLKERTR